MNRVDEEKQEAVKEIKKDAIAKLKIIEENILTGKGPIDVDLKINMLAAVNDDLSEALLNWEDLLFDSGIGDELM
jgi:hypothetical protein